MAKKYDVIIIGGGVIGSMVARYLSRYELKILLIEKESDIGSATSSANSAIMHAGYDPIPSTLKAKTNALASPLWDQLSQDLGFAFERTGDYVVATDPSDMPMLEELLERGQRNGIPGVTLISDKEMQMREPLISPKTIGALWAPTGGLIDTFAVTIAAAEHAVLNGVEVLLETEFQDFIWQDKRIIGVKTSRGDFACRWVVNAAGLFSDEVMHKAHIRPDFKIRPRRGEYAILDKADFRLTRDTCLFPTPSDKGKGIVVTSTMHGNTIAGPNSNYVDEKDDKTFTKEGFDEIWQGAQKLIPSINRRNIIAIFAGLRANGNARCLDPRVNYVGDFVIEIPSEIHGFINLGGIESPGLSASPGIALMVVDLLKKAGEPLIEKPYWNPIRKARPVFRHLTQLEQAALVKQDPNYGRIICRCENVTEGEILAEIHAPIPATTYDAIKRRTWTGTGRCQGGFDMPRVVKMLSNELGIPPEEVTKKGSGSPYLYRRTKDLVEVG